MTDINAEIIVVDNNSQDDSCAMVKELFPEILLIENHENTGFSKGNNIGVTRAKGEYVCILNPDTVIAEDVFSTAISFIDAKESVGIVGCRLIDGRGVFLPESKRNIPTPMVSFKKIFASGDLYYANHLKEKEVGEVPVLVGAFMMMKKKVYDELKGFDEDYFMYGEDIDLSYRALKKGLKNYYIGAVTCIHFKGESTPKNKIYRQRFYDAMRIFYRKHFKRNILLDAMVSIGSKMMPLFDSEKKGSTYTDKEEIIFDNNEMTFKEIITAFEEQSGAFKINPKNANFIIGSSSSKSKGEIRVAE